MHCHLWGSHHAKFDDDVFNSFWGNACKGQTRTDTHTHTDMGSIVIFSVTLDFENQNQSNYSPWNKLCRDWQPACRWLWSRTRSVSQSGWSCGVHSVLKKKNLGETEEWARSASITTENGMCNLGLCRWKEPALLKHTKNTQEDKNMNVFLFGHDKTMCTF